MTTAVKFITTLRERVPEVEPLYAEHLSYYEVLLPHIFIADVREFVEETNTSAANGSRRASELLARILDVFEEGATSENDETSNLIATSFLEGLERNHPHFALLKNLLGPTLSSDLEKQRGLFGDD